MCRQRINCQAVCSSENYAVSKKLHHKYLKDTHDERVKQIADMEITISNPTVKHNHQRPYIMVFDTKVVLNQEDALYASRAGFKVYYE